jgi:phenylalanyl-tRNA synthetase beta chain
MMKTPDLQPKKMPLSIGYVNKLLGTDYKRDEVAKLLEKMRHGIEKGKGDVLGVLVASYRTDVMHPIDLVEDVAIAYGYGNFVPEMPRIATVGGKDPLENFSATARELMLGYGFQEVMALIMTNRNNLFTRMAAKEEDVVEAENPVSAEHSIARTYLMPSLFSVLEKNRNREYPQRIFEIGDCLLGDGGDKRKTAALIAHSKANFSETKAIVTGLLASLGVSCEAKNGVHASFIDGRCAFLYEKKTSKKIGLFGEISPQVLENFGLEVPVSGFEIDLGTIFDICSE